MRTSILKTITFQCHSNDEILCLLIYIHLHKDVERGEKPKLRTFTNGVPKSQYKNREAFWTVLYSTEEIQIRRKYNL